MNTFSHTPTSLYGLTIAVFLLLFGLPISASADYWRGHVSEETIPATCNVGDLTVGAYCSGSNCDNTWLLCRDTNLPNLTNRVWQSYVSEEGNNVRYCGGNGFITGLAAKGRYGDNISIECSTYSGRAPVSGSCHWTASLSEEQGFRSFNGQFATAVQCTGGYCDNKRFLVCNLQ